MPWVRWTEERRQQVEEARREKVLDLMLVDHLEYLWYCPAIKDEERNTK